MNAFTEGLYLELKSAGSAVKVQALCPRLHLLRIPRRGGHRPQPDCQKPMAAAEDVVEASFRGLDRGDLFVIPGWRYKFLVRLLAVVPDSLRRWGTLRYAQRTKRV